MHGIKCGFDVFIVTESEILNASTNNIEIHSSIMFREFLSFSMFISHRFVVLTHLHPPLERY